MNKSITAVKSDTPETTSPHYMMKRIGNTNYKIAVYFSATNQETMSDKILRMIKNEMIGKAAGE